MVQGRDAIDAEVLWRVVQQMDLSRLFPRTESIQIRRSVAQVSAVHPDVVRALLPVLGGDIRRFTAFLMIAFVTLGEQRFKQDFCHDNQVHAARRLAERLAEMTPPAPSLDEMRTAYQAVLATAYVGGVESARPHDDAPGGAPAARSEPLRPGAGRPLVAAHPQLARALDALGRSTAAPPSPSR
jgi:hypothetical protein